VKLHGGKRIKKMRNIIRNPPGMRERGAKGPWLRKSELVKTKKKLRSGGET